MKNRNVILKILSLIVIASIGLSLSVNASNQYNKDLAISQLDAGKLYVDNESDEFILPDIISEKEQKERQYIARDRSQEKDLNTLVFKNADGTNTMRIFNHPVKYIDKAGNVRDITLNVQKDAEGNLITVDNNIITTFSKSLTDGVVVEYNDKEVTMLPIVAGKQNASVTSENNKDVFYTLDSKTSIRYSLTYTGVKEDIIVKEYTGQTEYKFLMRTDGLKLTKISENVFLTDEKDDIWGSLGNVNVLTADGKNDIVGTLKFEEIIPNEEYFVSVCVPDTFLSDPLTKYPICIDPTLTVNSTSIISDARISIGAMGGVGSGSETVSTIGADFNGQGTSRVLIKFPSLFSTSNLSVVKSREIVSASIKTYMITNSSISGSFAVSAYAYTAPWQEDTVVGNMNSWNSLHNTSISQTTYLAPPSEEKSINITSIVKSWCDYNLTETGANPDYGLLIVNSNESSTSNAKRINMSENSNPLSIEIVYHSSIINNEIYYLKNKNSGKYLTVSNNSPSNSVNVVQRKIEDTGTNLNAQRWRIVDLGNGLFKITSLLNENYCLNVASGNVNISNTTGNSAKWKILRNSDLHSYRILSMNSNYTDAVNIEGWSCENDANAITYPYQNGTTAANDEWIFEPVYNYSTSLLLDYRDAYWNVTKNDSDEFNGFCQTYPFFHDEYANCTNYVSQCMLAGGIHFQNAWHIYKINNNNPCVGNSQQLDASWEVQKLSLFESSPWISAKAFDTFWTQRVNRALFNFSTILENEDLLMNAGYEVGDVIMIADNDGKPRHAMIIVGFDYALKEIYFSGNTTSREYYPLSTIIDSYMDQGAFSNGGIYFYKMV